jgi:hypothetical protein
MFCVTLCVKTNLLKNYCATPYNLKSYEEKVRSRADEHCPQDTET